MQQINLYQPIFRKEKKIFSAIRLFHITGICLAVLVVIGVFFMIHLQRLKTNEQFLSTQYNRLKGSVDTLQNGAHASSLDELDARIARLEASLQDKQAVFKTMSALRDRSGETGFGPYLEALSRQRLAGLWLTGVQLSEGGSRMLLRGEALDPDLIPRYLQILPEEAPLQGLAFHQVTVTRHAEAPRRLDFTVEGKTASGQGVRP